MTPQRKINKLENSIIEFIYPIYPNSHKTTENSLHWIWIQMFDIYFLKLCWLLIVKFCSQQVCIAVGCVPSAGLPYCEWGVYTPPSGQTPPGHTHQWADPPGRHPVGRQPSRQTSPPGRHPWTYTPSRYPPLYHPTSMPHTLLDRMNGLLWADTPLYTTPPPPVDRMNGARLWKHYLPATSFAGGNQSILSSFCLKHLTNTFEKDGSWCEGCVTAQWHLHGRSKPTAVQTCCLQLLQSI